MEMLEVDGQFETDAVEVLRTTKTGKATSTYETFV